MSSQACFLTSHTRSHPHLTLLADLHSASLPDNAAEEEDEDEPDNDKDAATLEMEDVASLEVAQDQLTVMKFFEYLIEVVRLKPFQE